MNLIKYLPFKSLFEKASKRPTYVSVKPDKASIQKIGHLMKEIGLPYEKRVEPHELHATVCYSREPIEDPTVAVKHVLPIEATGDDLKVFKTKEDTDCLVLKLSSVELRALHHELRTAYGASHDYPTFEAHVTLCYDLPDGFRVPEDIKPIKLRFNDFESKELDTKWISNRLKQD